MPTYAVAHLRNVKIGPEITAYLECIDATLAPFDGQFLVHGGPVEMLEGERLGDVIIIAFPDQARARAWYSSAAYQAILPLRTNNSDGDVILIDTVADDHRATDILAL